MAVVRWILGKPNCDARARKNGQYEGAQHDRDLMIVEGEDSSGFAQDNQSGRQIQIAETGLFKTGLSEPGSLFEVAVQLVARRLRLRWAAFGQSTFLRFVDSSGLARFTGRASRRALGQGVQDVSKCEIGISD